MRLARPGSVLWRQALAFATALPKGTVIQYIDAGGKNHGPTSIDAIAYSPATHHLRCMCADRHPPVYKLHANNHDYQRQRQAQAAAVQARRNNRLKQVRFSAAMAPHDRAVHVQRVSGFLRDKGWRVRVTVADSKGGSANLDALARDICAQVRHCGAVEAGPLLENGHMAVVLKPLRNKKDSDE